MSNTKTSLTEYMESNKSQVIKDLSILIGAGVAAIMVLNYTTDIFKTARVIEKQTVIEFPTSTVVKASEYPDYDTAKGMTPLPLLENFETYTPNRQLDNKYISKGIILTEGKIARGYIEFNASIKGKPLTKSWESLYFKALYDKLDHHNYGGHIIGDASLAVPPSDKTDLLYALNSIPFFSDLSSKQPKTLDLFKIINDDKEVNFLTYISSLNPAKIDSIKIYYECDEAVNNGQCSLMLKK